MGKISETSVDLADPRGASTTSIDPRRAGSGSHDFSRRRSNRYACRTLNSSRQRSGKNVQANSGKSVRQRRWIAAARAAGFKSLKSLKKLALESLRIISSVGLA